MRDPRFPPVTPAELAGLRIEISILSLPHALRFNSAADLLALLEPHRHGIILQVDGRQSTFLPQVWEQLPDKVSFLEHLCEKARLDRDAWQKPSAQVSVYTVEAFAENEPGPSSFPP